MLADRRIVWDNDKQPQTLAGKVDPRWYARPRTRPVGRPITQTCLVCLHTPEANSTGFATRHLAWKWTPESKETENGIEATDTAPIRSVGVRKKMDKVVLGLVDNFSAITPAANPTPPSTPRSTGSAISSSSASRPPRRVGSRTELSKGENRFQATFGNGKLYTSHDRPLAAEFKNPSRRAR